MGKSSSTPSAPDPTTTAAAQTKYNDQAALYQAGLNNVNQVTPYGTETYTLGNTGSTSPTYDYDAYNKALAAYNAGGSNNGLPTQKMIAGHETSVPASGNGTAPQLSQFITNPGTTGTPQYTSTINLSPAEQTLLNNQQSLQTQAQGQAGTALNQFQTNQQTPYSLSGVPQLASANDVSNQASTVNQDILSRLQPQLDRDQEALDSKLANQGITLGSQAYNTAQTLQSQAKNDAYTQADLEGVQAGQIYNNEALANNQQGVANYNQQYYAPLNTYNSLQSGTQVTNPTFASTGNNTVAPADYSADVQNAYQAALNSSNASNASSNSLLGSLFGLGGSFLSGGLSTGLGALSGLGGLSSGATALASAGSIY